MVLSKLFSEFDNSIERRLTDKMDLLHLSLSLSLLPDPIQFLARSSRDRKVRLFNKKAKGKYNGGRGSPRHGTVARDVRRVTSWHFRSGSADVTRSLPPCFTRLRLSLSRARDCFSSALVLPPPPPPPAWGPRDIRHWKCSSRYALSLQATHAPSATIYRR